MTHCLPNSSDFFYKYESFDEPGCVFWGLLGRNNEGRVKISSDIIFHSPLSTKRGKAQLDAILDQCSLGSTPIKDSEKFKGAEAFWAEDIEFETKCLEIPLEFEEDDDLIDCMDGGDDGYAYKTVLFFGRKFLTQFEDSPQTSPLVNRGSGRKSGKDKESTASKSRNIPSPCPVPFKESKV